VIPNDFVWIFAGGVPPTAFSLKKIASSSERAMWTLESSKEAKQNAISKKELVRSLGSGYLLGTKKHHT